MVDTGGWLRTVAPMLDDLLAVLPTEAHLAALSLAITGDHPDAVEADLAFGAPAPTPATVALVSSAIAAGLDPLGDVFCVLRSPAARRAAGQFYTPAPIVDAMCNWVASSAAVRAVDAGCGSGRYAVALARSGFTGTIIAVDPDPLAVLMTRAHGRVAGVSLTVIRASFLDLDLPPVSGPTAWFGNPPYLRHHNLGAPVKAWAKATGAACGVAVSGLAGLHALFFLAVAAHGRPGDVGTFITSSEWFDNSYGALVRTLLTGPLGLTRLDVVPPATGTFADATTTAVITSFILGATADPLVADLLDPSAPPPLAGGRVLSRAALAASPRWTATLAGAPVAVPAGFVALGEHLGVARGIATGANKFFTMTPAAAAAAGLGRYGWPLIARAADVYAAGGLIRPAALPKVLLVLPDRGSDPVVDAYVTAAEAADVHLGYLNAARRIWYRVETPRPAPVVATYMARQAPRFAVNTALDSAGRAGALNLNNVHGLRPRHGFPPELVAPLVAWLNAHGDTLSGGRTYAGGLNKFEPSEMAALLVPDLAGLWALTAQASTPECLAAAGA